jgi:hypothetical protein
MKAFADVLPLLGAAPVPPAAVRVVHPPARPVAADEAALCAAAMRGERDAWSALVQRHNQRVVVALLARGVRVDKAKDIAQESWIRLVEQQRQGRLERL